MKRILSRLGHRRVFRVGGLTAVGLAAIGIATTMLAGGAGAAAPRRAAVTRAAPALIRAVPASGGQNSVLAYWTKARMAAAKPVGGGVAAAPGQATATNAGNTATGRPGTAGGYVPAGLSTIPGPASKVNTSTKSTSILPADGSYPGANTTFDWYPKYRTFPVSTIGKLFFTEPSGNFVCSAAATYGGSTLNMVWTAGHCVGPAGGQSYYANWLFCPSYVNGSENPAVGCWAWSLAQQTGAWYFNGAYDSDYAYLYMQASGDILHKSVVSAVGGLGFAWNWSRDQNWFDFGYPSASPYDGNAIVVTAAEHRYDVTNPDGGASTVQDNSIGSAQTPGFSGGPWILHFGGTGSDPQNPSNWINSDNSYYFTSGGPGGGNEFGVEIQGPYYNTAACNFWKGGSGFTGTC